MRQPDTDLLGHPIPPPAIQAVRRIGYAARPGTGPKGQRCNTCAHCIKITQHRQPARKCELKAPIWTTSAETDVKHNAPACRFWQRKKWEEAAA